MTLLPIIERELRLQARRASTIWLRVAAALLGGLFAIAILGSTTASGAGGPLPGTILFNTLSLLMFVICLVEGVRRTSDCLSSEKREGTLGLLLLTGLRGFDVVLGKLAALSVGSAYALIAVFPAMAMALPFGGLTGGEFWRVQLVLLETLFFGLAIGMWASARQSSANRALVAGFSLALVLTVAPMMIEFLLKRGQIPSISPGAAFRLAGDLAYRASPERFWLTVLAVNVVSWAILVLAGRRLLRFWQDEEIAPTLQSLLERTRAAADTGRWAPEGEPVWSEDWSAYRNSGRESERPDRSLIAKSPAEWLAAWVPQHRFLVGLSVFLLALGSFGGAFLMFLFRSIAVGGGLGSVVWMTSFLSWTFPAWLFLAFVSSRPLAEARRTGVLEVLLSTPLPVEEIVEAHWQGLWRQLGGPFKVACVFIGVVFLFSISWALTSGFDESSLYTVSQLAAGIGRIFTGLAVCRLGLYCGLKARSNLAAVGQTLVWTLVVPWFASLVLRPLYIALMGLSIPGVWLGFWSFSFALNGLGILYSLYVIRWSRQRLLSRFRELAANVATR